MSNDKLGPEEAEKLLEKLDQAARESGYQLNPDSDFTLELMQGLLANITRYGYQACPCRLASGDKTDDLDIICPCDYRDADLNEYGTCYCGLYVSKAVLASKKFKTIPERRPDKSERQMSKAIQGEMKLSNLTVPVWRCKVCGYLCGRENPPEVCPICKAKQERFERFI